MQRQEEVRLVRHFAFHVLMLLPVEVVKKRAGFWLQHVDGVPDLLHCCVSVATLQDPQVRVPEGFLAQHVVHSSCSHGRSGMHFF